MKKYTDTSPFNKVIKEVTNDVRFKGFDEDNNPIYDPNLPLPIVRAVGTIKIHGTNAGVGYDVKTKELKPLKRSGVMDAFVGHMGFNEFVYKNKEYWINYFNNLELENDITSVVVYGEWFGKGIQKNVAVSQLQKKFCAFNVCYFKKEGEAYIRVWSERLPENNVLPSNPESDIYNVFDFNYFDIIIDFNNVKRIQSTLDIITLAVEKECPVGKYFGVSGVGEGVVWDFVYEGKNYRFKSKGKKHSVTKSKEKSLNPIDIEKINSINDFVNFCVTDQRVDQAIENVHPNEDCDMIFMGQIIKWVLNDIIKEEMDTLTENDLTFDEVKKQIGRKVVQIYKNKIT